MNYLKIFLRHSLLLMVLLMAGCASQVTGIDMESEETNHTTVVHESDRIVPKDSTSELGLSDLLPASEAEEPVVIHSVSSSKQKVFDLIAETAAWTSPEEDNPSPDLLLPEVRIREKRKELTVIPPLFHFYEMGPQENEVEPFTAPEAAAETSIEKNPLPAASIHTERVTEEASTQIIVNESQMSSIVRTEIDITLSGRGWIYLSDEETSGIEYVGRHFLTDSTIYTFLPELVGTVVLRFQFQDLVNNSHTIEKINLKVIPAETDISKETMPSSAPVKYSENIDSADLEESLAALLDKNDSLGISEIAPDLVESILPSIRKQLPEIVELLFSSSYFVQSANILEELLKDKSHYSSIDRFLFLLGKIYEEDSSIRNEHTSASYYKMLIDGYPASIYWDESQDRYRFLKRRYIDIR